MIKTNISSLKSQPTPPWVKNISKNNNNTIQKSNKEKTTFSTNSGNKSKNNNKLNTSRQESKEVQKLKQRDRKVRQHEMAHKTVGGQYTGPTTYTYQKGPDGRLYAVGGEVQIDTNPVPNDPEKTIEKARTIKRAALAPANPSVQDLKIAGKANKMKLEAKTKLKKNNNQQISALNNNLLTSYQQPTANKKAQQLSLTA